MVYYSGFFFHRFRFLENHEVLLGKKVLGFFPFEPDSLHFQNSLLLCHFVQGLDHHGGVFLAVFYENDPSPWAKALEDGFHHFPWMVKFMVCINEEYQIDGIRRQLGVLNCAESRDDVGGASLLHAFSNDIEHLGLDVHCVDLPFVTCSLMGKEK